ncbi:MAG TPA: hypothetical protein VFB85_01315 [Vicinamibacterales bacterium]|nr:hypothetical protein [Vicinamibacterales bacterium]
MSGRSRTKRLSTTQAPTPTLTVRWTSVPTECPFPVLLIRGLNNGAWIAAALPENVAQ